jgi:hypothetical protein
MTGHDDEFDDFLRRRRPMFERPNDDLEPPAELDRIVLRQAREAIEMEKPARVFRAPYWSMPVALAATLVLAFTIILRVGMPAKHVKPEVTVQNVSRTIEYPGDAAPAAAPAAEMDARVAASAGAGAERAREEEPVVVDLSAAPANAQPAPARRYEKVADAQARAATTESSRGLMDASDQNGGVIINGQRADVTSAGELRAEPAIAAAKAEAAAPEWRRDSKTWLAEIERLRTAGDVARADAELAEYKRQHRAYAGAPDR